KRRVPVLHDVSARVSAVRSEKPQRTETVGPRSVLRKRDDELCGTPLGLAVRGPRQQSNCGGAGVSESSSRFGTPSYGDSSVHPPPTSRSYGRSERCVLALRV